MDDKVILNQDTMPLGEQNSPEDARVVPEDVDIEDCVFQGDCEDPQFSEDVDIDIPEFLLASAEVTADPVADVCDEEEEPADEPPLATAEPDGEESPADELDTEELLAMIEDDQPLVKVNRRRKKTTWKHGLLLYLHDLVYLLAAVIVIFLLLFRVVVVSGRSMNDTLNDGDYLLLLSNLFYSEPEAGDVIVAAKDDFKNGAPIVKRVIATEGQWVDIDFERGIVYVGTDLDHMVPLVEPYTKTSTTNAEGTVFPLQVEDGHIFVLGDNRGDSKDSRHPDIGLLDKREVMGKVIFLFFPGTNYGMRPRDFGRIGVVS